MAQIGTLNGGAGISTTIAGQSKCDELLVIGDFDTANPLQEISIEVGGTTFINIRSANLISAFMKYLNENVQGAGVGLSIKAATGKVKASTTYRFVNAGATTPNIYAFSTNSEGIPIEAASQTINPQSSETFDGFTALFLETPANISDVTISFRNGHQETVTPVELGALFGLENQCESNGYLAGVTVIDNKDAVIEKVRVNTNGVGACPVLVMKLPKAAFEEIKKSIRG